MPISKIKIFFCGIVLGVLAFAEWKIWQLPSQFFRTELFVAVNIAVLWIFYELWSQYQFRKDLSHLQKLQTLGRLVSGMAHDFNNILGGIIGAVEILDKKTAEQSELKKYLNIIEDACVRLQYLSKEVLGFSNKEESKTAIFCVDEVIGKTVDLARAGLEKKYEISYVGQDKESQVCFPVEALQSILLNLLLNAKDAMKKGGQIKIGMQKCQLKKHSQNLRLPVIVGDYVEICVADEGCGIKKKYLKQIFNPFFTTKGKGKGSGIGLASVYDYLKRYKGNIAVETSSNGSCFKIYLPIAKAGWKATAFILDDDEFFRKVLKEILQSLGLKVKVFSSADKMLEDAEKADVIWIDVQLKNDSGLSVYKIIRQQWKDKKIIFMSGNPCSDEIKKLKKKDVFINFIQKPCTENDCKAVLHNLNLD